MHIRRGALPDRAAIKELDETITVEERRAQAIDRWLSDGQCWVAVEERIVGYGVIAYTFFERGFVEVLYVAKSHRGRGVGLALMNHFCQICETADIFTSTNQSNVPMQRLLAKGGFRPSGLIENLDEGDPELVYFKPLRNKAA